MLELATWALAVAVPGYIGWRVSRAGVPGLFNALLYPLVLSYVYLLLPSLIAAESPVAQRLGLSDESQLVANALSAWYVLVFATGYVLTPNPTFMPSVKVRVRGHLQLAALVAQFTVALALVFILLRHGPELLSQSGDRGVAYDYYAAEILGAYPLPVLFAFAVAGGSTLYLSTGRKRHLLPLLLFVALDSLHGGRGYTFSALIVLYLTITTQNEAAFKKASAIAAVGAFAVFVSAFIRRYVMASATTDPMVAFFGEFYYTRLTARYVYDHMNAAGDVAGYLGTSLARLVPQFLIGPLLEAREAHGVLINADINAGFGLASSILSEALYYGGIEFAVISPLLMVALYRVIFRNAFTSRLPGFLLFVLTASSTHIYLRSGFYPQFFGTIYTGVVYLAVFVILGHKTRVFEPITEARLVQTGHVVP